MTTCWFAVEFDGDYMLSTWGKRFEKWSEHFLSRQFLCMHCLLGTLISGMRTWYVEDELLDPVRDEK